MTSRLFLRLVAGPLAGLITAGVQADPCGMVPPIYVGEGVPIERTGAQRTYVFHKNGVETVVIRPGFTGKVDEFGMLIPFPSPPAIRKVPDDIFGQIAAAIDPPEVVIDLRPLPPMARASAAPAGGMGGGLDMMDLAEDQVVVLREEAIGMYEVAVLDAGSARALKRWMDERGYVFPSGMDAVCDEYVADGWCFVAVKTRVGRTAAVTPRPGMREADATMPDGFGFDGFVQAMGFRFRSDEMVIPMRLSTFNGDDLHNVVYALTDGPCRLEGIDEDTVVRQIPGSDLYRNVTEPLPLRVIGGEPKDIPQWQRENLIQRRDPTPHNGAARELFAGDLLAAATGALGHPFEEMEKELLSIGERLGLRGPELDRLHHEALAVERGSALGTSLAGLEGMTMTVIDGDFPKTLLARENLTTASFAIAPGRNRPEMYDAKQEGPAPEARGRVYRGAALIRTDDHRPVYAGVPLVAIVLVSVPLGIGLVLARRRRIGAMVLIAGALVGLGALAAPAVAQTGAALDAAALYERAKGGWKIVDRGHAVVALADSRDPRADEYLARLADNGSLPTLVRVWAQAARVERASFDELVELAAGPMITPALLRPMRLRLESLLGDGREIAVRDLLLLAQRTPQLQSVLGASILGRGPGPLVEAMRTDADQELRRLAAGYLAALATRDPDADVAGAVVAAYAFSVDRDGIPWDGGPLFVPALPWQNSPTQAKALVRHLIAWHLWADRFGRQDLQRPIDNNLRSVQLAVAAGYAPNWGNVTTVDWLRIWATAHGRIEAWTILREQGVENDPKYAAVARGG